MTKGEDKRPVYLMVPRHAVVATVTAFAVLFIGVLASFQYANYVDRRGNQQLCGIIKISDDTNKQLPPTSARGKELAREFTTIRRTYKCK